METPTFEQRIDNARNAADDAINLGAGPLQPADVYARALLLALGQQLRLLAVIAEDVHAIRAEAGNIAERWS